MSDGGSQNHAPPQTILFVEDEALIRMDMAEFLARVRIPRPWPRTDAPSASAPLAATAVAVNKSAVCTACHLDQFQGDAAMSTWREVVAAA